MSLSNDTKLSPWFCPADCKENVLLQDRYHPGLFISSKWSCCDHRSKHSQGCAESFATLVQPQRLSVSPPGVGRGPPGRGPLPPTPMEHEPGVCMHVLCGREGGREGGRWLVGSLYHCTTLYWHNSTCTCRSALDLALLLWRWSHLSTVGIVVLPGSILVGSWAAAVLKSTL